MVPVTEMGRRLVEIDATGFMGRTGLCPGQITLANGTETLAYRFITLTADDAVSLLDQLDEQVEEMNHAASVD